MKAIKWQTKWVVGTVAVLLVILEAQLLLSVRQNSQTFDESAHIYSGYSYWKTGDFGINPEHPPLEKLVDALPLLPTGIKAPPPLPIHFRGASGFGGIQLLYSNEADSLLFRARAMATLFTLACALLVFLAAYEMFGAGTGLIALLLFVFEPNILANGALVTTDIGAACFVFATVYAFYRYCKKPSILRLSICCLAAGLALAAKHSTVLLLPIFVILAIYEIARRRSQQSGTIESRAHRALRLLGTMAAITFVAVAILWCFYGFRYAARPGNAPMIPGTAEYVNSLKYPTEANIIRFMENHHIMPEAYLFGMTDIVMISRTGRPTFLLGHDFTSGRWFYFPTVFAIKCTLGFMLLLALIFATRAMWRQEHRRELVFLLAPPLLWLAVAMTSKLDLGVRHILPMFPFLVVLAAAVAWTLAQRSRAWTVAVVALLAFHAVSSLHTYPNYLPYSNEAFGGPSNTYKVVSDANVGWESGLKTLANYVNSRHITQCWFAFDGLNDPAYYHIPCKPLPTLFSVLTGRTQAAVPEQIQGPVFLGSAELTGFDFGPDDMNPYQQFVNLHPTEVLGGEILEFDGTFQIPAIAGVSHFGVANVLMQQKQFDAVVQECKMASELDPKLIYPHEMLSAIYAQRKQLDDAVNEYQLAMHIYQTVHPDYQVYNDAPVNPLGKH